MKDGQRLCPRTGRAWWPRDCKATRCRYEQAGECNAPKPEACAPEADWDGRGNPTWVRR